MENEKEKISFEEAFSRLQSAAESISGDDVELEKAIESYKEGSRYYQICSKMLEEAEQLIQIFDKTTDSVKELE